jgi:hypothetical protein
MNTSNKNILSALFKFIIYCRGGHCYHSLRTPAQSDGSKRCCVMDTDGLRSNRSCLLPAPLGLVIQYRYASLIDGGYVLGNAPSGDFVVVRTSQSVLT